MDLAYLLILDAAVLIFVTAVLTYFFLIDIFRQKKKKN